MTTEKHQWLIDQSLKVHNAIDDNLEEWLTRVSKEYDHIFSTLIDEFESIMKDFKAGRITEERLRDRYTTLTVQAQQRATEIGIELTQELPEKLQQYANLTYAHMNEVLKSAIGTALPVYSIEFAAGFRYEDYVFQSSIHKSGIKLGQKLNKILSEGLAKGWGIREYSKELRKVTDFTVYEANRIARTETARVATEGAKRSFKEYDVERVRWIATLEKRTCQRCAALHNKTFKLGQEPPLPLHPHCRCVLVPVIEGYN